MLFKLLQDENKDGFLPCFGKYLVGCFDITAWGYYSYLQPKTFMHHWPNFILASVSSPENIAINHECFNIYYLRWFVIIHAEAFLKRKKKTWNRSFIVVQEKLYRAYLDLFRLVGWWQSSLGIKKSWQGTHMREQQTNLV